MSSDLSRLPFQPRDQYAGIVAQQGRVVLDRDLNALQQIALDRLAAETLEIVGPCGTPDDGFRIDLPSSSPPNPFFSPPEASPPAPSEPFGSDRDFLISPGVMYLGGQRVEFPALENGQAVAYSYEDQPDWPAPDHANDKSGQELVYLDACLQEVGAVEDPDLFEVALGGPDTTQRLRFLKRVKRLGVDASDCATAWEQAQRLWAASGLVFDPAGMSLTPAIRLQVGFTEDVGDGDPCDPVATGGYLGAENQLIRVRIANDGQEPTIVWGYDNASFLYRITAISPDGATLTLAGGPPDAFHAPQTGQVVEILSTATVLGSEPDVTDPTGMGQILRVAAESTGGLYSLAQPYGPITQGDPTSYIVLADPVDPAVAAGPLPLFLRVWQAQLPFVAGAPITLEDPATGISTGVTVTFSDAQVPADGAVWEIAVRPSTPQGVYPKDLLVRPQCAVGPVRYVCPLAVIDWLADGGPTISDCRNGFDNLVDLSRRKAGCCTVSIAPQDVSGAAGLQTLIDRAAGLARNVTVCLASGEYPLPAPLRLGPAHFGMTIESCGGPAVLLADPGADPAAFFEGLVILDRVAGVSLRGLGLEPPLAPIPPLFLKFLLRHFVNEVTKSEALSLLRGPTLSIGVRAFEARALSLRDCTVRFLEQRADTSADLFGAAVFLQGDCAGLSIQDCVFDSRIPATYTPIGTLAGYTDFLPKTQLPEAEIVPVQGVDKAQPAPAADPVPAVAHIFDVAKELMYGHAFATVMTNRGAAAFAARQRPMTAIAGVLGLEYGDPASDQGVNTELGSKIPSLRCSLGDCEVRGAQMTGLTFGALAIADFDVLRLQDNRISGGVAGLWVSLPGSKTPANLAKGSGLYFDTVGAFEEALFLVALGAILPPPSAGDQWGGAIIGATGLSPYKSESVALAGETATVFISGNHISTGQHPPRGKAAGNSAASRVGTSALLLWLDNTANEKILQYSDVSTLITGNHLTNTDLAAPTALVVLPDLQACAITGNIILNRPLAIAEDERAPSLWVVIDRASDRPNPLAVTGNVLGGRSDIGVFVRPDAAARPGWSSYNADPA
jgi:hypothetical protein